MKDEYVKYVSNKKVEFIEPFFYERREIYPNKDIAGTNTIIYRDTEISTKNGFALADIVYYRVKFQDDGCGKVVAELLSNADSEDVFYTVKIKEEREVPFYCQSVRSETNEK